MLSGWTQELQETRRVVDHILSRYTQHMDKGQGDYHPTNHGGPGGPAAGKAGTGGV